MDSDEWSPQGPACEHRAALAAPSTRPLTGLRQHTAPRGQCHALEAVNYSFARVVAHTTCRMRNYRWGLEGHGRDAGEDDGEDRPFSRPRQELNARKGQGLTSSRKDTVQRKEEDSETKMCMGLVSGRTLPESQSSASPALRAPRIQSAPSSASRRVPCTSLHRE